ncbi:NUDIX domain-containing protein [Nocardioides jishulii]|uniref:NUDIX domain-containing protein n=1 Tax=Nocardioides jishulii TaxID=2575440 RepID=A0A4U2YNT5_9ACTN|nr:NUDIX domain-containing protein [Nocardioides jishulii]QCX27853.1 NUDIX domain-containing protein [Nocardioides jishulii]TKI62660.1 NUDIX domain-containing protein [Nocardioides jishulii]
MPVRSAGLLVHRTGEQGLEVLLVHPGGPFWARKDAGVWSIPKGEYLEDEEPLAAARREFAEEVGQPAPAGDVVDLGALRQPSGKVVQAYAVEGDVDLTDFRSNTFELEWPRGSGRVQHFPEVDRAAWVGVERARELLLRGQVPFLDALVERMRPDPT